jgi:hypothetical protein
MPRIRHRILPLVAALVLAGGLTACDGGDDEVAEDAEEAGEQIGEATEEAAEEVGEAAEEAGEEIEESTQN